MPLTSLVLFTFSYFSLPNDDDDDDENDDDDNADDFDEEDEEEQDVGYRKRPWHSSL